MKDGRSREEQERIALGFIKRAGGVVSIFWITGNNRRACAVQRLQDRGDIIRVQSDKRDHYPYCVFKVRRESRF